MVRSGVRRPRKLNISSGLNPAKALLGILLGVSLSGCQREAGCSSLPPVFSLAREGEGPAHYALPKRYAPTILSDVVDRRRVVNGAVASVTYCVKSPNEAVIATSASLSDEGLQTLIRERPALTGVDLLIWRPEIGGLPMTGKLPVTKMDGFLRYQAKGAFYLIEADPAAGAAPISAHCTEPTALAPVRCRLYAPVPGKFTVQMDFPIDRLPPRRWTDAVRDAEHFLDSHKS
jgi:hypothetical protein